MAYEVVINKRFIIKLQKVIDYLDKNWGTKIADEFYELVVYKIKLLASSSIYRHGN
jgi:hypothetical protein